MPFWPFRKKPKPVKEPLKKPVKKTRWQVCIGRHKQNPTKAVEEWFVRHFNLFTHFERARQFTAEFFAQHPNMGEDPRLITEEALEDFAKVKATEMEQRQQPR